MWIHVVLCCVERWRARDVAQCECCFRALRRSTALFCWNSKNRIERFVKCLNNVLIFIIFLLFGGQLKRRVRAHDCLVRSVANWLITLSSIFNWAFFLLCRSFLKPHCFAASSFFVSFSIVKFKAPSYNN